MNVVIPPISVIYNFSKVVRPLLMRIDRAREESQTIAALRDTLLPKLISGELRVKDVQRILGEPKLAPTARRQPIVPVG